MNSYAFCPISDEKINERVTRFNALFTVVVLLAFALTRSIPLLLLLWIDFLLRAIPLSKYSLIAIASRTITRYLPTGNMINAGPKIFAARVGLLFTTLILLLYLLKFLIAAMVFTGILALFAFLEGVFGICVACIIYPYLYKFTYKRDYSGE